MEMKLAEKLAEAIVQTSSSMLPVSVVIVNDFDLKDAVITLLRSDYKYLVDVPVMVNKYQEPTISVASNY